MEDGSTPALMETAQPWDDELGQSAATIDERRAHCLARELTDTRSQLIGVETELEAVRDECRKTRAELDRSLMRYESALADLAEALKIADRAIAERDLAVKWLAQKQ